MSIKEIEQNSLDISKDSNPVFRDDLRVPKVVFGRCQITGIWGKCITIDLGDLCIEHPNLEKGVEIDPETKAVNFTIWKPVVFQQQITLSEQGLQLALDYLKSQDNPIPELKPELVYQWVVLYKDGGGIRQFAFTEDTSEEIENNSRLIDFPNIQQISVIPKVNNDLPIYTFESEFFKFYKNGEELDIEYPSKIPIGAVPVYARKVTHTWGSWIDGKDLGLDRCIANVKTSILQLLGWKDGDLLDPEAKSCIIAIDEQGNWRLWEVNE